jgi:hypothetical protein
MQVALGSLQAFAPPADVGRKGGREGGREEGREGGRERESGRAATITRAEFVAACEVLDTSV